MTADVSALLESPRDCSKIRAKELILAYKIVEELPGPGPVLTYVDCRFYMGRSPASSTIYCILWTHSESRSGFGIGKAGGHGYHKRSAAADFAISSSGITLLKESGEKAHIHSVGDSAIREALRAISTALGASDHAILVETYP